LKGMRAHPVSTCQLSFMQPSETACPLPLRALGWPYSHTPVTARRFFQQLTTFPAGFFSALARRGANLQKSRLRKLRKVFVQPVRTEALHGVDNVRWRRNHSLQCGTDFLEVGIDELGQYRAFTLGG